jgi:DNA-binding transcriptional ArsR family regulator
MVDLDSCSTLTALIEIIIREGSVGSAHVDVREGRGHPSAMVPRFDSAPEMQNPAGKGGAATGEPGKINRCGDADLPPSLGLSQRENGCFRGRRSYVCCWTLLLVGPDPRRIRMFAETIRHAAMAVPRQELPKLSGQIWKAFAAGLVNELEAAELAELVEARKTIPIVRPAPRCVGSRPRTPASLERRRRWVASGMMPPAVACLFTPAETAVLAMVAAEVSKRGECRLPIGAIAALAGVSKTSVRNALRAAKEAGLISVKERRLSRWRNLSNVVSITSREWTTWLTIGATGGGRKFVQWTPKNNITRFAPFEQQRLGGSVQRAAGGVTERRGRLRAPSGG